MALSATIRGMWLLDGEALKGLDAVLDSEISTAAAAADKEFEKAVQKAREDARKQGEYDNVTAEQRKKLNEKIRKEVKQNFDARVFGPVREVTLLCASKQQRTKERFSELLQDGTLSAERVTAFTVSAKYYGLECKVVFEPEPGKGRMRMVVGASPDGKSGEALHGKLVQWVQDNQAPKHWVAWRTMAVVQWFILFVGGIFLLIVALEGNKRANTQQAREMVAEGVNEKNQHQAIELILRILSNAPPTRKENTFPGWFWWVAGASVCLCVVISYCPDDVIGIGKGAKSLARWRAFGRYAKWIIVAIVLCGVVPSVLGNFFTDLIKGLFSGE